MKKINNNKKTPPKTVKEKKCLLVLLAAAAPDLRAHLNAIVRIVMRTTFPVRYNYNELNHKKGG